MENEKNKEYEKIKKIIESCHINFLFGAGASMPFLETLGNIEEEISKIENLDKPDIENIADIKKILTAHCKIKYFNQSIKGSLKIINDDKKDSNLTETKKNYDNFINAIEKILYYRKTNLINKQVNIFTTNVDIFFENAIENKGMMYNDGFLGRIDPTFSTSNYNYTYSKSSLFYDNKSEIPSINLFKLHGGVNWTKKDKVDKNKENDVCLDMNLSSIKNIKDFCENKYTYIADFNKNYKEDLCKEEIDYSNLITKIQKKYQQENISHIVKEVDQFNNLYNNIVMVNPTKKKFEETTMKKTYYEQLRMFSNRLEKENSALFVIGFSFADEHIRDIVLRIAESNPTLIIIIFAYDEYSLKELHKYGIKYINNIETITGKYEEELSLKKINKDYFVRLQNELEVFSEKGNKYE